MLPAATCGERCLDPRSRPRWSAISASRRAASQYLRTERQAEQNEALARQQLGDAFAGSWIERREDGSFVYVVAASGLSAAKVVLPGDIEVRNVRHSLKALEATKTALDDMVQRSPKGIAVLQGVHAWHVDPQSNSVVVAVAADTLAKGIDLVARSSADAARSGSRHGRPAELFATVRVASST